MRLVEWEKNSGACYLQHTSNTMVYVESKGWKIFGIRTR